MLLWIAVIFWVVAVSWIAFRGAPYVPTHAKTIAAALDLLDLKKGDRLVDLGSGDGSVLVVAARRGLKVTGYEINPILCAISWLRLRRFKNSQVKIRDFWLVNLPPDTKAVFVFAAGPFMNHLAAKLHEQMQTRQIPLKIVSNAFQIPTLKPQKTINGLYLYVLKL